MKVSPKAITQVINKSKEKKPTGMLAQMGSAAENIASQISSGNPQSPMQQPSIMNRMRQATNVASGIFGGSNHQPMNNAFSQLRSSLNVNPAPQNQLRPNPMQQVGAAQSSAQTQVPQVNPQLPATVPQAGQQPEAQQQMQPAGQSPQGAEAPAQDNSAIDQQIAALQAQIQQLQSQKK